MRKVILPALISFLLSSSGAAAEFERCTQIDNDLERLACYDQEAGYEPIVREISGRGDWRVRIEKSLIDDSENVFLSLSSKEQTNCPYKSGTHQIYIACRENTTSVWVIFGGCFMSSIQGKGRVTYRLDSEKASTKDFRESNDNSALGLWNGGSSIPFIKQLLGHDRLVIRAMPFSDSTVTGQYNISGLDEAIVPLREACHW